jgi:hypothetical protein
MIITRIAALVKRMNADDHTNDYRPGADPRQQKGIHTIGPFTGYPPQSFFWEADRGEQEAGGLDSSAAGGRPTVSKRAS